MTTEFISEFEITYDVYLDWVKHPLGRKARKNHIKRVLWKFGGLLISVFLILIGVFLPDNAALYIGIAFSGAMLYMVTLNANTAAKKQYQLAIKANDGQPWKRTFSFSDVIRMTDFRTDAEYKYSQVTQLTDDARYLYVWLGVDFVLRIPKNSMTKGSAQALAGFIESKKKKPKKAKKS